MRATLAAVLSLGITAGSLKAQATAWQPAAGHVQVPIWPGGAPRARPAPGPEQVTLYTRKLVGGRPYNYIENVSRPTITVYSPTASNTGAAVIVYPGGGYSILAIDLEGTEVCDWLVAKGITCILLKYRVPNRNRTWDQQCGCDRVTRSSMPLEDAQRSMRLVRSRAAEWHVDPRKIGVLGFSAGGHLVAALSMQYGRRLYPRVDAADTLSARPDFAVAVYPGHLYDHRLQRPVRDIRVTSATPPTFIVQAQDDSVDTVRNALVYYTALRNAGVPAELHIFPEGGHAFGLRRTRMPITAWPDLVETWLTSMGVIQ